MMALTNRLTAIHRQGLTITAHHLTPAQHYLRQTPSTITFASYYDPTTTRRKRPLSFSTSSPAFLTSPSLSSPLLLLARSTNHPRSVHCGGSIQLSTSGQVTTRQQPHGVNGSFLSSRFYHGITREYTCPPAASTIRHYHPTDAPHSHETEQSNQSSSSSSSSSNRAAFQATPIIPSILSYIQKIGVGIRPKKRQGGKLFRTRKQNTLQSNNNSSGSSPVENNNNNHHRGGSKNKNTRSNSTTLDEKGEMEYFLNAERQHRLHWQNNQRAAAATGGAGGGKSSKDGDAKQKKEAMERMSMKGAYWLPPPPFSTHLKEGASGNHAKEDSINGRKVIRQPVKLLGKAGSLNDKLPLESKGLSEVALAGRSNVGKSTLLNALLYGNTDANLSPRKYQRGKTPDGAKLPKGVKAVTSNKPGETKELSFYQLTADVIFQQNKDDENADNQKDDDAVQQQPVAEKGKMSLLLVDLPGYGFAFAKEERTKDWQDLMHHYLLERQSLKRILLLLDARHGFKKSDFDFLSSLQDALITNSAEGKSTKRELPPIQIVLTKCDLVPQADLARRVVLVRQQLSDFLIREPSSLPVMLVSARAGLGFNNIWKEQPQGGVLELQREVASLVPVPRVHSKKNLNKRF